VIEILTQGCSQNLGMIEAPPAFFEIQLITFIVTIGLQQGGDIGVIRYIGACIYLTTGLFGNAPGPCRRASDPWRPKARG